MAVVVPSVKTSAAVEMVREQHWVELGDWLGKKPYEVKQTMKLWFSLLHQLGYDLVPTGMNAAVPRQTAPAEPDPPLISQGELFRAVEDGLAEVVQRRFQGERVSDQDETRAIVASVVACMTKATPGSVSEH